MQDMRRKVVSMVVVALVALSLTVGTALAAPPETVCFHVGGVQTEIDVPAQGDVATLLVERGIATLGPCPAPYA